MKFDTASRKDISAVLSRRLRVFGFISALLIVILHSTPRPDIGTLQWWIVGVLGRDGLCRIAVPYFFFTSGFFLAGHVCEDGWWHSEVGKRVKTLVVPYFVWIGIGLIVRSAIWYWIQKTGKLCGFPAPVYGPVHVWVMDVLGLDPFANKVGILWFMRDLFALTLISPFLIFMLKRFSWLFVVIIFALYGGMAILQTGMSKRWYNFFEYFMSLRGLFYFTIGLTTRYAGVLTSDKGVRIVCLGAGMCVIKLILLRYSFFRVAAVVDVAMVPILMAGVGCYVIRGLKLPPWIMSNTFPIYLLHQNLLLLSTAAISAIGLKGCANFSILIWLIRILFAVLMSIIIACCIRHFFPRASNLLFGGR